MDPNANLKEQREIIARLQSDQVVALERLIYADRLAELAQALDEWITKGGALPDAWTIHA